MKKQFELFYIARYPFLLDSQDTIKHITNYTQNEIEFYLEEAIKRIKESVLLNKKESWRDNEDGVTVEIASYRFAQVLVSCVRNQSGIRALANYEAKRSLYFLEWVEDNEDIKSEIYYDLGIPFNTDIIKLPRYIEITQNLRDNSFRLVNRDVWSGNVEVSIEDKKILPFERIKMLILEQLPLKVPESICKQLSTAVTQVEAIIAERAVEEYGDVEESRFPPCIHALFEAAVTGKYLTHSGRFALTTFLHTIGMDVTEIISTFSQGSDFNIEVTSYQVNHIISQGSDGYTTPSCATMMTHGICSGKNAKCKHISHPLSYYRKEKKQNKRPASKNNSSGQNNEEKEDI